MPRTTPTSKKPTRSKPMTILQVERELVIACAWAYDKGFHLVSTFGGLRIHGPSRTVSVGPCLHVFEAWMLSQDALTLPSEAYADLSSAYRMSPLVSRAIVAHTGLEWLPPYSSKARTIDELFLGLQDNRSYAVDSPWYALGQRVYRAHVSANDRRRNRGPWTFFYARRMNVEVGASSVPEAAWAEVAAQHATVGEPHLYRAFPGPRARPKKTKSGPS